MTKTPWGNRDEWNHLRRLFASRLSLAAAALAPGCGARRILVKGWMLRWYRLSGGACRAGRPSRPPDFATEPGPSSIRVHHTTGAPGRLHTFVRVVTEDGNGAGPPTGRSADS